MQNFGYIILFPSIFILLFLEKWSKIAYYTNETVIIYHFLLTFFPLTFKWEYYLKEAIIIVCSL